MAKPRVIHKWERYTVYGIAAIVDVAQIILDFFVVGVVINRIIDIVMGIIIGCYAVIRRLFTIKKAFTFTAYFIAEVIPYVDVLPFWTLDILNLYGGTVHSKEESETEVNQKGSSNQNMVRLPKKPPLLNSLKGIRLPNGGLKPPILGK